jgi:hypothetical protein
MNNKTRQKPYKCTRIIRVVFYTTVQLVNVHAIWTVISYPYIVERYAKPIIIRIVSELCVTDKNTFVDNLFRLTTMHIVSDLVERKCLIWGSAMGFRCGVPLRGFAPARRRGSYVGVLLWGSAVGFRYGVSPPYDEEGAILGFRPRPMCN